MGWYQWEGDTLYLNLHVQPRASRDEIVGPHGDSLKVRITTPPVDGKANSHLIKFVAKSFGIAPSQVAITSGECSREKRLSLKSPKKLPSSSQITY